MRNKLFHTSVCIYILGHDFTKVVLKYSVVYTFMSSNNDPNSQKYRVIKICVIINSIS